jgi:hypothetical protein
MRSEWLVPKNLLSHDFEFIHAIASQKYPEAESGRV